LSIEPVFQFTDADFGLLNFFVEVIGFSVAVSFVGNHAKRHRQERQKRAARQAFFVPMVARLGS